MKLEQSESYKGPRIIPCSEKAISILGTILIVIHPTKPIFRHDQLFDGSSPYVKFGRNRVINDYIRVSINATDRCQVVGILMPILVIGQSPYLNLGESLIKVIQSNWVIID